MAWRLWCGARTTRTREYHPDLTWNSALLHCSLSLSCWLGCACRRYLAATGYREEARLVMPDGMVAAWIMDAGFVVSKRGRFERYLGLPEPMHAEVPLKQ